MQAVGAAEGTGMALGMATVGQCNGTPAPPSATPNASAHLPHAPDRLRHVLLNVQVDAVMALRADLADVTQKLHTAESTKGALEGDIATLTAQARLVVTECSMIWRGERGLALACSTDLQLLIELRSCPGAGPAWAGAGCQHTCVGMRSTWRQCVVCLCSPPIQCHAHKRHGGCA